MFSQPHLIPRGMWEFDGTWSLGKWGDTQKLPLYHLLGLDAPQSILSIWPLLPKPEKRLAGPIATLHSTQLGKELQSQVSATFRNPHVLPFLSLWKGSLGPQETISVFPLLTRISLHSSKQALASPTKPSEWRWAGLSSGCQTIPF